MLQPKYFFLTKGVGTHKHELRSFECALKNAGISQFNIVKVSSIIPPYCKKIQKQEGLKMMKPGQVAFCHLAKISSNEKDRILSTAIGLARPNTEAKHRYLSEYQGFGKRSDELTQYVEDLALNTYISSLENGTENQELDGKALTSLGSNIKAKPELISKESTCSVAKVDEENVFTTVIAAAVFLH